AYNFKIIHRHGRKHSNVDALSRLPETSVGPPEQLSEPEPQSMADMDLTHYRHLLQYLDTKRLPTTLDEDQKRKLVKKSEFYEMQEVLLYKKDRRKEGNLLR
ncbi:39681_t:CDS:2, partial [Gigaspora margarita]